MKTQDINFDDFCDVFDESFDQLPISNNPVDILKSCGIINNAESYSNTISALSEGRNNKNDVKIYDQALHTAVNILNNHIASHKSQFMVFSGTQAGKTNLMTTYALLHSDFISNDKNCIDSNKKTVVYVFGPPPTDLQSQTINRFIEANLYRSIYSDGDMNDRPRYITPMNLSERGNKEFGELLESDRSKGYSIVFFFDEAHEGSGINTQKDIKAMQKLQSFCKKYNVPLMGQDVPFGRELLEVGIHITATPAHLLQEFKKQENKFIISVLKPGHGYFGVLDHDEADRIYDVCKVPSLSDLCGNEPHRKNKAKKFFMSLLAEYISHNHKNKDSGHLIFRYTSSSKKCSPKDIFSNWLSKHEDKVDFREFSSKKRNMHVMNKYISQPPPAGVTSIVFVKQGLGRGITLDNKSYIQLCFENRSNDASTLQSFIGRLTGYGLDFHHMLKIYTDRDVIESQRRWLEMFTSDTHHADVNDLNKNMVSLAKDINFVQSGTHLKKSKIENFEANIEMDRIFETKEEALSYVRNTYPNYMINGANLSCSTCSGVKSKDVAEIVRTGLSSARLSGAKLVDFNCGYRVVLIHVDGANESHKNSWQQLKGSSKSHYIGKYLVRYAKHNSKTIIRNNTSNWG